MLILCVIKLEYIHTEQCPVLTIHQITWHLTGALKCYTPQLLLYRRPNLHAYEVMFFQQLLFCHTIEEFQCPKNMGYRAKIKVDSTYQSQQCNCKVKV